MTIRFLFSLSLVLALTVAGCERVGPALRANEPRNVDSHFVDIPTILSDRVHDAQRNVGIAAGVASAEKQRVFVDGVRVAGTGQAVSEDTIFEIGSVTKIFTAVLLADMVIRGEVALDDPIADYLPPEVIIPNGAGQKITLLHLATHTAGFPRNPPNADVQNEHGAFATYSEHKLFEYLRQFEPDTAPGAKYSYSNVGMGLLGFILARHVGLSYEQLARERIFDPLGMADSQVGAGSGQSGGFAEPHNAAGDPIGRWEFDALAGAGGIRSTARDMLRFAAVAAGLADGPDIARSIRATYENRYSIPGGDNQFYLGWIFPSEIRGGGEIFWHDGGTGGSRSFIGITTSAKRREAVVVLSNSAFSVNDIGLHLIDPEYPLRVLERLQEISMPADVVAKFVGTYRLSDVEDLVISERDGQLFAQVTNDGEYPVFPYKKYAFFYRVADAQIEFNFDSQGAVASLTLLAEGHPRSAVRIDRNRSNEKTTAAGR